MSKKPLSYRLSPHFVPERYALTLEPSLVEHTFLGRVEIHFTLKKPASEITLHAVELALHSASLSLKSDTQTPTTITHTPKSETVTLRFPKVIPKGAGVLTITYSGILNDKMRGFYRSTYTTHEKVETMAVTQFESTFARFALPCIDEPAMKAEFDVALIIEPNLTAISNTIEESSDVLPDGRLKVTYRRTPKMSTYLLAFLVGRFESIEKQSKGGTLVRVFVTKGKEHQAQFALDVAVKCLDFYEKYFKIRYPLPTLDNIAVPDFAAGAMENWGAVTYRETALLYDPLESSAQNKQRVALVIAHELAHQWFGNLVTMEWWTDLWLNEGFANYIEYLAIDSIFPEWDVWTQFVHVDANEAMRLDALKATHPIEVEVNHPSEVNEIFDAVSYAKGATVIRMLAEYLGERDFREGLHEYLKRHAYKNAKTLDLWAALERVSGKPVRKIMAGWTKQAGYPLVNLERRDKKIHLTQRRYYSSMAHEEKTNERWAIPVRMSIGGKRTAAVLFDTKTTSFPCPEKAPWVYANTEAVGMYRTKYDSASLLALTAAVRSGTLSPVERVRVVNDVFTLAFSDDAAITDALTLLAAFTYEKDYTVWSSILAELDTLSTLVEGTAAEALLHEFMQRFLTPIATHVGWSAKPKEKHTTQLLRGLIMSTLVSVNHEKTIAECVRRFKAHEKGTRLPPDLRPAVYAAYVKAEGATGVENIIAHYEREHMHAEKNRLLIALGRAPRAAHLKKALTYSLGKQVRFQDTRWTFLSAARSERGARVAWDVITKNWDTIVDRYGKSGHDLPRFVHCASMFASREAYQEVKTFFKSHKAQGAERAVEQALESIASRTEWRKKNSAAVAEWLTECKASLSR